MGKYFKGKRMEIILRIYESIIVLLIFCFIIISTIELIKEKPIKPQKIIKKPFKIQKKICTETQPFFVSPRKGIICNFICDGNCILKKENGSLD